MAFHTNQLIGKYIPASVLNLLLEPLKDHKQIYSCKSFSLLDEKKNNKLRN